MAIFLVELMDDEEKHKIFLKKRYQFYLNTQLHLRIVEEVPNLLEESQKFWRANSKLIHI